MGTRTQTHCKWGHLFDQRNTYFSKRKARGTRKAGVFRRCRACTLESHKDYETYRRTTPKKKPR